MLKISIISMVLLLSFSGCSFKFGTESETVKEVKTIEILQKNEYTELEKELIEIAKENKRMYNEYSEILTSLQKRTKLYDNTKIPKRLSRRMTFHYEGPALTLLKTIAEETMYNFQYEKYRTYDSKNIVRHYTDSMLIDIIHDIANELSFNVIIDEKDDSISLQEF